MRFAKIQEKSCGVTMDPIQPSEPDDDEDEPRPPVVPLPNSKKTLEACALNGMDVSELEFRELGSFRKDKKELEEVPMPTRSICCCAHRYGTLRAVCAYYLAYLPYFDYGVVGQVVFRRYNAYERGRLAKLDAVLASTSALEESNGDAAEATALLLAQQSQNSKAMQLEVERLSRLKLQQQRKAEKEVRQVLLAQAAAAEMEEQNRKRAAEERRRDAEREAEVKRKRDEFNLRKQEMERLKQEDEVARNARLRQEQLERLEREKIRLADLEIKEKERKKEITRKQKQKVRIFALVLHFDSQNLSRQVLLTDSMRVVGGEAEGAQDDDGCKNTPEGTSSGKTAIRDGRERPH
jgi:hypothetical protein